MTTPSQEAREAYDKACLCATRAKALEIIQSLLDSAVAGKDEENKAIHNVLSDVDNDCGEMGTLDRAKRAIETIRAFERGVREVCCELGFDPSDGEDTISHVLESATRKVKEQRDDRDRFEKCYNGLRLAVEGYDEQATALKAELAQLREERDKARNELDQMASLNNAAILRMASERNQVCDALRTRAEAAEKALGQLRGAGSVEESHTVSASSQPSPQDGMAILESWVKTWHRLRMPIKKPITSDTSPGSAPDTSVCFTWYWRSPEGKLRQSAWRFGDMRAAMDSETTNDEEWTLIKETTAYEAMTTRPMSGHHSNK